MSRQSVSSTSIFSDYSKVLVAEYAVPLRDRHGAWWEPGAEWLSEVCADKPIGGRAMLAWERRPWAEYDWDLTGVRRFFAREKRDARKGLEQ